MIGVHAYAAKVSLHPLVTLTQVLSILQFKRFNPTRELHLYTDSKTLKMYQEFGIDKMYDVVNTSVLNNYPKNRISTSFWATPKLWVMKHMTQPFAMIDVDLSWKEDLSEYEKYDMTYLHRESSVLYPLPHRITKPYGFEWSDDEKLGFRESLPINCGVTTWTNMEMLKEYVNRYFDFVLDNKGEMILDQQDLFYIDKTGAQITAEQWLLASIDYNWTTFKGAKTRSIINMLSFNFLNRTYDFTVSHSTPSVNTVYHLWGAKKFYDNGEYSAHLQVVNKLRSWLNEFIPHTPGLRMTVDLIMATLPPVPNI